MQGCFTAGVVGGVSSSKDRDVAKAIYDLSQAIAMEPVAETYFMRAELHEIVRSLFCEHTCTHTHTLTRLAR